MTAIPLSTARSAGIVKALLYTLATTKDWSSLPRDGVLACLRDLQAEIDKGYESAGRVTATHLEAQECR
jgi:hypothetical protein